MAAMQPSGTARDPRRVPVVPGPPHLPPRYGQPPPRPNRRGIPAWVWAVVAGAATLVLVGGIALVWAIRTNDGGGGSTGGDNATVRITNCETESSSILNTVTISYEVTNSSSRTQDVLIDFSATAADGTRVGTTSAMEPDVPPGQKAIGEATIFVPEGRSASRCKVDRVR